jgi:Tol biopolymer transport system component
LERIVEKALAKDREERYQVAKDMVLDLKRLRQRLDVEAEIERSVTPERGVEDRRAATGGGQAGTGHLAAGRTGGAAYARTTSSAEYIVTEIKRHKRGALLALVILLAVAMGVVFGLYKLGSTNKVATPIQEVKISRLTETGRALWTSLSISPDGKYVTYVTDETGRQGLWVKHVATASNMQIVAPAEVEYRGVTFSRDGNYIYYVSSYRNDAQGSLYQVPVLGGHAKKVLAGIDGPVTFSPDGKRFAFVRDYLSRGERALMVANADGGGERELATRKNPDYFVRRGPAWSPDGKVIACPAGSNIGSYQNVVEVQVEGGTEKPISARRFAEVGQVTWLPDGSGLIMTAADKRSDPIQIYHLSYPRGELRRITNDLSSYFSVSLAADLGAIAAVQDEVRSQLWVVPNAEAGRAKQITSGKYDGADGTCWTPDGRIIYQSTASGGHELWVTGADGRDQRQLTFHTSGEDSSPSVASGSPSVSPDGRYVVFHSNRAGSFDIWRMDIDGGAFKQLTTGGGEFGPSISPDGQWVVYTSNSAGKDALMKVSIEGGDPVRLTETPSPGPAISPDGKLVACYYGDERSNSGWKIALIPFEGGPPVRLFDVAPTVDLSVPIRWQPDGQGVAYIDTRNGVSNIWGQPTGGGAAKQLTDFNAGRIFRFAWSPDGKDLACARGSQISDVVLISNYR